ncbi:hypothetical protein I3843_13G028900 [Carya illinoinensis]|uniref:Uncharacterized protein n=1 Tax=Carya illinoinensis TaxID=32201 RepID=A0A8T1NLG1_CARIL|nr:uncharacterized protein LOC122291922 isoform X1 [Carya illinoinensis]KAG6630610.1 hypothetical protein CIPAW_13G031200 [Carya illinoinensis]KAG6630611.1 hypothetical protein CIPAW_13G031200 [Carya illinoinensis]KAG6630612.1 hypothetical protein CIPAW_13G031200 [Carya illinoinensis]KAG7948829.1 hypothetical protein I3843_13G028900 [Carya illinoinensis]
MNSQTLATVAESSEAMPTPPSSDYSIGSTITKNLGETMPWVEHAVQQAQLYQKAVEEAIDSAVEASKSRLSEIRSTSSAHLHQTIGSLQDLKSEYASYEEVFFGKIKEGVVIAASHPVITSGVGLGLIVLQRPWHSLYYRARYKAMRLFLSQEAILSRADTRVKELQKSIDSLKAESETLEKMAVDGEEVLKRGIKKLRQAGKQIQGVIRSAHKIERQAGGLKDILGELPRREASLFRSQVSNLASEAKRERKALTKQVSKISDYGISV